MKNTYFREFEKTLPPLVVGTAHPSITRMTDPGATAQDEKEAFRFLDELWDIGLHMYDAAAIYGEEALGRYLHERKRHQEAIVLTKCAHPNQFRNRVTPFDMESDLNDSLAKLQTDHIDMYVLHRDDPSVPVSVIVETLNRFHKEGKIGLFGGSNWTVERIKEANAFALENNMLPFTISSPNYGLAHQVKDLWGWGSTTLTGPEHEADRAWYVQHEMPVFAYSCMAHGFFSGKFKSGEWEKAEKTLDSFAQKGYLYEENMERLRRAEMLAEKYGCGVSEIAIAFMTKQNLQVYPILSGSKPIYFRKALEAMQLPITAEELRWVNLEEKREDVR